MRIGVLAYDTPTGLGYQVKSYIKHLPVTKIMEVDLTMFNGMPKMNWYTDTQKVIGYPTNEQFMEFCLDLDTILLAETPLNYDLYAIARSMGVRTAVVINWEFFDHLVKPELPKPDLVIMPSTWHADEAEQWCLRNGVEYAQIHHPVDRDEFKFRQRTTHQTMHLAGKPATNDRNGTFEYLNAFIDGTVITQSQDFAKQINREYRHATVHSDVTENSAIYDYGDILVLPRKYGGNCLPLNEALSRGLPVIMPCISPNNSILPAEWLYEAHKVDEFTPRTKIDIYEGTTSALLETYNKMLKIDPKELSKKANEIADSISWDNLREKYMGVL
jgi:hypothetical protein